MLKNRYFTIKYITQQKAGAFTPGMKEKKLVKYNGSQQTVQLK
jgi:hypothetical protein